MYVEKSNIKGIQLDHTSRCNLLCPQCARTDNDGLLKNSIKFHDLTVENYKVIFSTLSKNVRIMHCGNYGDVIASPTFDDTLDWCLTNGYNNIQILTNGSARKPDWWKKLAKAGISVVFSVDGLQDTNHIYRVNSNFSTIIDNIQTYTAAGGKARWDYLVFNHNYHQIEEAQQLAKRLGVEEFNIKYTSRFVIPHSNEHKNTFVTKTNQEVTDIKENKNVSAFQEIVQVYEDFNDYAKKTPISCKYQQLKRYYIDMEMRVWPCCWMGAPLYSNNMEDPQYVDMRKVFTRFGENFNRLDIHGWDNILNSEYYQSFLENTWIPNSQDRIYTCGRTCGEKYQFSSGYGSNTKVEKL